MRASSSSPGSASCPRPTPTSSRRCPSWTRRSAGARRAAPAGSATTATATGTERAMAAPGRRRARGPGTSGRRCRPSAPSNRCRPGTRPAPHPCSTAWIGSPAASASFPSRTGMWRISPPRHSAHRPRPPRSASSTASLQARQARSTGRPHHSCACSPTSAPGGCSTGRRARSSATSRTRRERRRSRSRAPPT